MSNFYIVATTGGRNMHNVTLVRHSLDKLADQLFDHDGEETLALAQGDCPSGADDLVRDWAMDHGVPCVGLPAPWKTLGKAAGPIRNGWLLDIVKPDVLYAYPGTRGTASMVQAAHSRGIPVMTFK